MTAKLRRSLAEYSVVFRHWPPLALIVVATLLTQSAYAMITPTLPLYLRTARLGTPLLAIGFIFAAYAIAETLFKAPGGAVGDRWGRTRVALAGLVVGTISPVLMTVVHRWEFFVPLRAIDGLGVALVWPTMMALIGEKMPSQDRALAMSLFNLPYLGGLILGMAAGLRIGDVTGDNRYVFYTSSALLLVAAVCMVVMALWDRAWQRRQPPAADPPRPPVVLTEDDGPLSRCWWDRLRRLRERQGTLLNMLWIFLFVQMGASLVIPILTIYARDGLGLTQTGMVKLFAIPGLLAAALALPLGRAADRLGRSRAIQGGLAIGAVGFGLLPLAGSTAWLVVVLMSMLGVSYVVVMPAWMALTSQLAPAGRQGLVLGAMNTSQGVGFVVASLLGAGLYGLNRAAPFYLAGILLAVCAVLCTFLIHEPHDDASASGPESSTLPVHCPR
ncbi:MAG TPA: MFS transporter [Armatimonadota bacterium]|jgi:MFS family permease